MPKLVLIEWLDSHQGMRWTNDETASEPLLCRSVGWRVYYGDTAKSVAAHMTVEDTPQRPGEMTIPACAITKIKSLE